MAKRKATKNQADGKAASDGVEPMVIALAEQLGSFLGRVQAKADGWLDNETLQKQVSQIRDGAAELLKQVNAAGIAARRTVAEATTAAKAKAKSAAKSAAAPTPAAPKRGARESGMKPSRGAVDAPGKRHRKPPPQETIGRHMGEPVGKQMGQKNMKNRMRSGRG